VERVQPGQALKRSATGQAAAAVEIYPTSFGSARGYRLAECLDAFKRYVPAAELDETVKVSKPIVRQAFLSLGNRQRRPVVTVGKSTKYRRQ
jgi:hypothetical protein